MLIYVEPILERKGKGILHMYHWTYIKAFNFNFYVVVLLEHIKFYAN
jgi:hypothetical protein